MENYFAEFIRKLTKELTGPLPGEEYQFLMAPQVRRMMKGDYPERRAAVLVLLYPHKDKINLVFIKRQEYEGPHSGQISFPGGMYEDKDDNLGETARRETREETGVNHRDIQVIGMLTPLHIPVSNILVQPFVGFIPYSPVFDPDPAEVEFIITSELNALQDKSCIKKEEWILSGQSVRVPFFSINSHKVWGATAMILSEFLEIMARSGLLQNPDRN